METKKQKKPSATNTGRLQSLRNRPESSFVTGILAEANAREMMSLRVMPCDSTGGSLRGGPMYPPVTHTDRYVQRRDPDRAVKPPPLELPRRQD